MSDPEIRKAAIKVMKDGGRAICESAIAKWRSGYYGDIPYEDHLKHWSAIHDEINALCSQLKETK